MALRHLKSGLQSSENGYRWHALEFEVGKYLGIFVIFEYMGGIEVCTLGKR